MFIAHYTTLTEVTWILAEKHTKYTIVNIIQDSVTPTSDICLPICVHLIHTVVVTAAGWCGHHVVFLFM